MFQATTNFWQTKLDSRLNRAKLIEFEQSGLLRLSVRVEIHPGAVMDELPLMVTLGCYLIVMTNMDAAVATTATMG